MSELSKALLDWYDVHHRVLPWRETKGPYRIWVSEIMLQQTRVETVKPYYLRWMEAFPNIKALAEAPEEAYLKLWEGLGYYSRVRNLAKGAKAIQEQYLGVMPETKKELLSIPGIGSYTASAILAIAFGEKEIAVDGNLIRIYARLTKSSIVPNDVSSKKACEDYLLQHIDEDRAGDFNQWISANLYASQMEHQSVCNAPSLVFAKPISKARKLPIHFQNERLKSAKRRERSSA